MPAEVVVNLTESIADLPLREFKRRQLEEQKEANDRMYAMDKWNAWIHGVRLLSNLRTEYEEVVFMEREQKSADMDTHSLALMMLKLPDAFWREADIVHRVIDANGLVLAAEAED